MNTTIKDMEPREATMRLTQIVTEGYHHLNRYQLPDNLGDMVARLKADLIKYMPGVTLEVIDEALTHEILHDEKLARTPSIFSAVYVFQAVGKHYTKPTETRDEDKDELWQWKERLRWYESHGQAATTEADECRWWIYHIEKGDDEGETIRLLDICADWVKKGDERQQTFTVQTKDGIVIELPAFNPRREFAYLVTKGLLSLSDTDAFFDQALTDVNTQRLAERHHRLTRDEARTHPDVVAMQKRLAVIGWLRRCNTNKTTPSAILTPLIDETKYQLLRREA